MPTRNLNGRALYDWTASSTLHWDEGTRPEPGAAGSLHVIIKSDKDAFAEHMNMPVGWIFLVSYRPARCLCRDLNDRSSSNPFTVR